MHHPPTSPPPKPRGCDERVITCKSGEKGTIARPLTVSGIFDSLPPATNLDRRQFAVLRYDHYRQYKLLTTTIRNRTPTLCGICTAKKARLSPTDLQY